MRRGDELIHVLTHHIRLTEDQLRENLQCYILNRLDWVEKISARVLKQRNQSLEDYIDEITTPGVPLDPIALFVFARMYKIHIAIFTAKGIWATCRDTTLKKVQFVLLWYGGNKFIETVKIGKSEMYRYWIHEQSTLQRMPSHQRNCIPGTVKIETAATIAKTLPHKEIVPMFPPLLKKELKTELKPEVKIKRSPELKPVLVRCETPQKISNCTPKVEKFYQSVKWKLELVNKNENEGSAENGNKEKTEEIFVVGASKPKKRKRLKIKTEPKAKEPQDSDIKITGAQGPTTEGLFKLMQKAIERAKGKLRGQSTAEIVAQQQRQRRRTQERVALQQQQIQPVTMQQHRQYRKRVPLACPVCNQLLPSQKAMITHVKTDHTHYRYPCGNCPRTFSSFNTRYKHMKEHSLPQLYCPVCKKGFHFQSELDRHTPVHSAVLPFPVFTV